MGCGGLAGLGVGEDVAAAQPWMLDRSGSAAGADALDNEVLDHVAADDADSHLRVRGVEGLRVVDSSVFLNQPSANTSAPTKALAWHAADLIAQES
ncbi:MAG: hypothetical protein GX610_10730 [Rhodococcus sp.]|nr:hypothetical protein [Rhodococcus sp. (in: high G+C Gram-positive bacteria)]